ncbi:alpha/beta fold hydrolase [Alcaligenaceae bacterium]|nr:alpha/beta fold hydrolase [Alcaligenaceae bacterium]
MSQDNLNKTYVLLHGAWHGGWCWKHVALALQAAGHKVFTPTQTGLGERSHLLSKDISLDTFIKDVINVLEWEDLNDVILVGHSFGGIGISGAADRVPYRIRHLVYLDSLILQNGDSPFSVIPEEVANARRKLAQEFSAGVSIPIPAPSAFGVTEPGQAAWIQEKCTPHPMSTYEDTLVLNNPVGNGLPATYIAVTPHYGPTTASREFAKQQSWCYMEIEAGHDAMLTSADAVTRILLSL